MRRYKNFAGFPPLRGFQPAMEVRCLGGLEMKLVRVRGEKTYRVTVPKELEPFVEYMFRQGYSESTIAGVVNDLRIVMKHGLTEKDLSEMSGKKGIRLRYAWRHYKKFQKLNGGGDGCGNSN